MVNVFGGVEGLDTTEREPVRAMEVWCVSCEATGMVRGEKCSHCGGKKKVKVPVSVRKP